LLLRLLLLLLALGRLSGKEKLSRFLPASFDGCLPEERQELKMGAMHR